LRGTTPPTEIEKLTLVSGCTFNRAIDCVIRVCCCGAMFTWALTLVFDDGVCAVLGRVAGAGVCAVLGWVAGAGVCAVLGWVAGAGDCAVPG
jgi:hypothetical protein